MIKFTIRVNVVGVQGEIQSWMNSNSSTFIRSSTRNRTFNHCNQGHFRTLSHQGQVRGPHSPLYVCFQVHFRNLGCRWVFGHSLFLGDISGVRLAQGRLSDLGLAFRSRSRPGTGLLIVLFPGHGPGPRICHPTLHSRLLTVDRRLVMIKCTQARQCRYTYQYRCEMRRKHESIPSLVTRSTWLPTENYTKKTAHLKTRPRPLQELLLQHRFRGLQTWTTPTLQWLPQIRWLL